MCLAWQIRFNHAKSMSRTHLQITYTTCDFRIWFLYLFMYSFNMQRKYSHFTKMLKNDKKPTSQGVRRTVHGERSQVVQTRHMTSRTTGLRSKPRFPLHVHLLPPDRSLSDEGVFWANQGECWDMEESTVLQSPLELFQGSPALRKLEPGVQHNVCRDSFEGRSLEERGFWLL